MTLDELRADVVVLACAVSAGVHGALAPAHFAEGAAAGTGFALTAVVLGALALGITRYPAVVVPQAAAAIVFAGSIASYALAVTTGVPFLHPEPEAIDRLALATKAIETIGLVAAVGGLRSPSPATLPEAKGHLT